MSDRLSVYEDRCAYRICWICDGEREANLGDRGKINEVPIGNDGYESYVIDKAVRALPGWEHDSQGFLFERRSDAVAAKKAADFARKNIEAPMPEWAVKAAAAGWKAPKGWKP